MWLLWRWWDTPDGSSRFLTRRPDPSSGVPVEPYLAIPLDRSEQTDRVHQGVRSILIDALELLPEAEQPCVQCWHDYRFHEPSGEFRCTVANCVCCGFSLLYTTLRDEDA